MANTKTKKIKVLTTIEEVNQHLENGWEILKIFSVDCFLVRLSEVEK